MCHTAAASESTRRFLNEDEDEDGKARVRGSNDECSQSENYLRKYLLGEKPGLREKNVSRISVRTRPSETRFVINRERQDANANAISEQLGAGSSRSVSMKFGEHAASIHPLFGTFAHRSGA